MPDWTYHTMFKPVLTELPAKTGREFIHRGMHRIAAVPGGSKLIEYLGHTAPAEQLKTHLFGLEISNPVGLSGKIDPQLTGTKAFVHLGMGFIEIGPVTSEAEKSGAPVFTQSKDNIIFPRALESLGTEQTAAKLKSLRLFNKPILIRIGKTASFDETLSLLQEMSDNASAFIVEDRFTDHEWQSLRRSGIGRPVLYACAADQLDVSYIDNLSEKKLIDGIIIDEQGTDEGEGVAYTIAQADYLSEKVTEVKKHRHIAQAC